jgi:phenylalanyl-tRNA synthetase beta chain
MLVDDAITHARIEDVIRTAAPPELTAIRLFDIFRGEGIGEGHKSLAYSLEFRSAERSLTDEDANAYHESIKKALRTELDAEIRDK